MVQNITVRISSAQKPHGDRDTKRDAGRSQDRVHNIDQPGNKISLQHFPDPVGGTERTDQQHDDSDHDPVLMRADSQKIHPDDHYFCQKRQDQVIDQKVALPFSQPVPHKHDHQGHQRRYQSVHKPTAKEHRKPGPAHDPGRIGQNKRLLLPVHDLQKLLMKLIRVRCILTDIPGQIIQIIQAVVIDPRRFNMPDLGQELSIRRLHCNLNITGNRKHIISFESVAFTHTVQRIIQAEILRSAAQHSFTDVKNPFQNPFVIHFYIHPPV